MPRFTKQGLDKLPGMSQALAGRRHTSGNVSWHAHAAASVVSWPIARPAVASAWNAAAVVNLNAAKTLGITIPQSLPLRADKVIQ